MAKHAGTLERLREVKGLLSATNREIAKRTQLTAEARKNGIAMGMLRIAAVDAAIRMMEADDEA